MTRFSSIPPLRVLIILLQTCSMEAIGQGHGGWMKMVSGHAMIDIKRLFRDDHNMEKISDELQYNNSQHNIAQSSLAWSVQSSALSRNDIVHKYGIIFVNNNKQTRVLLCSKICAKTPPPTPSFSIYFVILKLTCAVLVQ